MCTRFYTTRTRGVAVVEMALVMPLLLLLVFGLIEYALAFHALHNMTNAAREGARQMAVRGGTSSQAQAAALAELSNINATFTVTTSQAPSADGTGTDVTVHVSVPWSQVSLTIPGIATAQTLNSEVTMRQEQ